MIIDTQLTSTDLTTKLETFWALSAQKITAIDREYDPSQGAPVFTVNGRYTTRGWTEWTQGFQVGSAILQFDAQQDSQFLDMGREATRQHMAAHVGHFGVHDHGFNNVSTYGNLLRLMHEGRIEFNAWEKDFYELALKLSGAVQAKRWTPIPEGGFLYSFNGPHSLFVDTIRSCRALMVSHGLGYSLWTDNDVMINLLDRAVKHCLATAQYAVYFGKGRDSYDLCGRTAHESVFNTNDGQYRCPNSQQGYSGFSTWTRGLSWAMVGFAEQLEFLHTLEDAELAPCGGRETIEQVFRKAAQATCDFYIQNTPTDGIPYWDTGAPQLHKLGDTLNQPADPFNAFEPVDSSAATIGAQGLLRLGHYLQQSGDAQGEIYWQAGLTVLDRLLEAPYLSTEASHQGLILHSIYHQPNAWDHIPEGSQIANGESSQWGDYHAREAALYVQRMIDQESYYTFFGCLGGKSAS
ncbi:MAG: glycosyl hydrolase [Planctomycetes bacterium]|nr:glycosyl hydrolase [Planctomycetota bacterium]